MVGSPISKRPVGTSAASHRESSLHSSSSVTKRRHNSSSSSAAASLRSPPPPLKLSPKEALFRILCPSDLTGGVIGKGGSIVRQLREETEVKIRIGESIPGSTDRVIIVVGDCQKKRVDGEGLRRDAHEEEASLVQLALFRVFERVLKAEEEKSEAGEGGRSGGAVGREEKEIRGPAVCRLLAPTSQVGCVLGRGGKIVENIRKESGAQVRVFREEHLPACASAGDELIQISGNFLSVKKALLSVSSRLQENPAVENTNFAIPKPFGATAQLTASLEQMDPYGHRSHLTNAQVTENQFRGYSKNPGTEYTVPATRNIPEEEVVFRILCSNDKVGSIIGKGGVIIRSLQSETGATIRILQLVPGSEERVILISARETPESRYSPAQEAVLRVHSRLVEIDNGSSISARLLVPAQQIGCLLGKGGAIISEMRRATGASIRIFLKEQVPKCAQPNDEVVQVSGTARSVQDGLVRITGRIRETIFPPKNFSGSGMTHYTSSTSETPDFLRSGHEVSLGRFSATNVSRSSDASIGFYDHSDRKHHVSHNTSNHGIEQVPYSYGRGTTGSHSVHDRPSPSSSKPLAPEVFNSVPDNPPEQSNMNTCMVDKNEITETGNQTPSGIRTDEMWVPKQYLPFLYSEEEDNLIDIRQYSGASVVIHDSAEPEDPHGLVLITGTESQILDARSLLIGFVMRGVHKK